MPKERIDNLEFWYGTPDAPAPHGNVSGDDLSLVVGASSDAAAELVTVRYRGLGEAWQSLPRQGVDRGASGYYAHFRFPPSESRARIEYEVLAQFAGKSPERIGPTQTFRVVPATAPPRVARSRPIDGPRAERRTLTA